ncbi:MAG TPA: alpha/beta hydrolase-fold protein [Pedobacter sp.]|jgi:predicted alpha/beta superfamily hydrolase
MKHLITLLLILNLGHYAMAQGKPDSIYSKILNEKRQLKVLLPSNYKPESKEKYDVIYILDGEGNLEIFSQIHSFAKKEGYVPEVILVAVVNTIRNRDLTPTMMKSIEGTGGADNFISFFKEELIPYINKTYPSNGQSILYGHSFGGLFAVYTMFSDPTIFSTYLATDPSLWYDKDLVNKMADEKLKNFSQPNQILYISGLDQSLKGMGISKMDSILKLQAPKNLTYKVVPYENETHGSVQLKTIYDGLKFVYEGYRTSKRPIEFHPLNGIVLKDKPYSIYNFDKNTALHYTLNDAIPTLESAKLKEVNTFSGPMNLKVKSFASNSRYDKNGSGKFILGKALASVTKPKIFKSGGLLYSYYEGKWDSLPDFKKIKPVLSGVADSNFTFRNLPSKENYALVFEGMVEIKEDGYHLFGIDSDDGSKLYLNNKILINYDGMHRHRSPQSYLIPLKKGFYPLRLEYFQKGGGADLELKYIVPGKNEPVDIPSELLYHIKSNK